MKCADRRSLCVNEVQMAFSARGRRGGRVAVMLQEVKFPQFQRFLYDLYSGADKSLARPGRKQATATEDSDVHISYLLSQLEEY